ncbi:hypothetical protein V8C35DRAFT_298640 [Trichoderma chlorosporum]
MFEAGVRYSIYPHQIFLYTGKRSNQLFLGSVASSDLLCAGQSNWMEYWIKQEIDGIFQPFEMRVLQAQDTQYIELTEKYPAMKKVLSLIQKINHLSMHAEDDQRRAYYKKEYAKSLSRQIYNHDHKIQSLVLKYGAA